MRITKIKISKLFDLFDYDFSLEKEENLLIITGPNGFGKTMILNIIYSFFNKRFFFFQKLIFGEILIYLSEGITITIQRKIGGKEKNPIVNFIILEGERKIDEFSNDNKNDILIQIEKFNPHIRRIDVDKWLDRRNNRLLTFDDIGEYIDQLPLGIQTGKTVEFENPKTINIFNTLKVHLIKEQRLFTKVQVDERRSMLEERNSSFMTDTIREYAKELSKQINITLQKSLQISQELDSSFPKRLLSTSGILNETDFDQRFSILKEQQHKLKRYGLSESEQEVPTFDNENAKVLLVYLNDTEKKLGVFDSLLSRLELFTDILNERRFTFKSIKIDREKGFKFLTQKGVELSLTDLSSGEQHEVVLLYELIFNAKQNTLVLIDEPEISLHISWQKEFLTDLLRIIDLQQMQVIIATHSPQIINDRWDLVYNLEMQND